MASGTIFEHAATLLQGNFTTDPADRDDGHMTGYGAMKRALGMVPDDPAVAYNGSTWPSLDSAIRQPLAVLDKIVSEQVGDRTQFSIWATAEGRTVEEVLTVLDLGAKTAPEFSTSHPAVLRPNTSGLPGQRKIRWVICNQLGTVAAGADIEVVEVVRDIQRRHLATDLEVIAALDSVIEMSDWNAVAGSRSMPHVQLSHVWGLLMRQRYTTLSELLGWIGDDAFWNSCSDSQLQRMLCRIIKEDNPKSTACDKIHSG